MNLIILGVVIGANNLAVSVALGALEQFPRRWRIVFTFGVFEFFVPLVGIWIGNQMSIRLAEKGEWIGPTLLALVGIWSVVEAFRDSRGHEKLARKLTSWLGLTFLAASLSIDNLIVGFSLGLRSVEPLALAVVISGCSMVFSYLGLLLGKKTRLRYEFLAQFGAGVLLVLLAIANYLGWV